MSKDNMMGLWRPPEPIRGLTILPFAAAGTLLVSALALDLGNELLDRAAIRVGQAILAASKTCTPPATMTISGQRPWRYGYRAPIGPKVPTPGSRHGEDGGDKPPAVVPPRISLPDDHRDARDGA